MQKAPLINVISTVRCSILHPTRRYPIHHQLIAPQCYIRLWPVIFVLYLQEIILNSHDSWDISNFYLITIYQHVCKSIENYGEKTKKWEIMEICWNPFRSHFLNLDVSAAQPLSFQWKFQFNFFYNSLKKLKLPQRTQRKAHKKSNKCNQPWC